MIQYYGGRFKTAIRAFCPYLNSELIKAYPFYLNECENLDQPKL